MSLSHGSDFFLFIVTLVTTKSCSHSLTVFLCIERKKFLISAHTPHRMPKFLLSVSQINLVLSHGNGIKVASKQSRLRKASLKGFHEPLTKVGL